MIRPVCEHRGSQRRADCCGGKAISRWICRERKKPSDGKSPMDCVLTEREWLAHKSMAPTAMHEHWENSVAICENCPLYRAKCESST